MNDLSAVGIALNSALWLAAWYRGRPNRTRPEAPAWRQRGRTLALAGLPLQLAGAALLHGALAGAALVASAWMFSGLVFVLGVNASPGRALTVATCVGSAGAVAALLGALDRVWSG